MRIRVLITTFLLLHLNSMAADTTLVKLMGAVYKEVVGKHQRYFYVLDEAKAPDLDRYHIDKNALDKLGMSANIPLSEMISLIPNDTISFKWSDHPFFQSKIRRLGSFTYL
jgi:hypothetical protein